MQSAGKIPVDVQALGVDLLSLSAHKFYGPKGVGALWIRRGTRMLPILTGGKQERSRRAGTENVPAIVGMGVAARLAAGKMAAEAPRLAALRDRLEAGILRARAGHGASTARAQPRVPNTTQHQLRSRRGRDPADRARSRRHRRVDRIGVFVGHARAVARAEGDGASRAPRRRTRSASASGCSRPTRKSIASIAVLPRLVEKLRSLTRTPVSSSRQTHETSELARKLRAS